MRALLGLLAEIVNGQKKIKMGQRTIIVQQRSMLTMLSRLHEGLTHMATTEELAQLEESLGTSLTQLTTTLSGVSGDVSELKRMLEEAQTGGTELDLTRATALAGNIAGVTQAFADLDAQTPGTQPSAESFE